MDVKEHPAYQEESRNLARTISWIDRNLNEDSLRERQIYRQAREASITYSQANSQEDIELNLNNQIYASIYERVNQLRRARPKPYFARIDFREDSDDKKKQFYIGKASIIEGEEAPMVIDWRAPVSDLYYDGRLGTTSYSAPEGRITGELLVKRQLTVEDGQLEKIFDIDVTADDDLLQEYLGAHADNRLKDIVVTIQSEQNQIIRAELNRNLIIQGVAGSGKTTVALHRIAYLLYNYPNVPADKYLIIAPNRLFLDYISEVLPDLGVERVRQTTFVDWALERIGEEVLVVDRHTKLANMIEATDRCLTTEVQQGKELLEFKSTVAFMEIINAYLSELEQSILPERNFGYDDLVVCSRSEIEEIFMSYKDWPIYQRIDQLAKHLRKKLTSYREDYVDRLQDGCLEKIAQIKQAMDDSKLRSRLIDQVITEKNEKVRKMEDFAKNGLREYLKVIHRLSSLKLYQNLFADADCFLRLVDHRIDRETVRLIREKTLADLAAGRVEEEDLAPLVYLRYSTFGWKDDYGFKQIVIDEAQDYSIFQYLTLKTIFKEATFTILGDLCQGIYGFQGIEQWEALQVEVFGEAGSEMQILNKSYRTTIEIMTAANGLAHELGVSESYRAVPVIRHGEEVQVVWKSDLTAIVIDMVERLREMGGMAYKSIAIIAKTKAEAEEISFLLKKHKRKHQLIKGNEEIYSGGLVVLPVHLVKGLEFDAVLIADASRKKYKANLIDARLLYVAMTRPLHRLFLYFSGEVSELLR